MVQTTHRTEYGPMPIGPTPLPSSNLQNFTTKDGFFQNHGGYGILPVRNRPLQDQRHGRQSLDHLTGISVGEHDWTIHYYPREGPSKDGVESASVYVGLERASVDVTATLECALLDKNGHASSTMFNKYSCTFSSDCDDLWGWPYFMPRTDLEETYVKDGFFVLKVSITVKDESCPPEACPDCAIVASPHVLFPYERTKRFREEEIRTDVTFDVDGSSFVAHRLILAAHSPVFEAELFGAMAESSMDCIKISEMMPSVFNAMLDFMYSGSLPVAEEPKDDENATAPSTSFFQDLLVVADRYAVDRLRSMCERKLLASIRSENVLSLLELAERRSCANLKADCLKFIANKDNLVNLVLTKACIKLLHNCPSLLDELNEMASK